MEVSLFYQLPAWPEQQPAQRYEDTLRQVALGDTLGFPTAWFAELHFEPNYGVMPSPFLFAAAAAQRTQRIGIGTAVTLLPLHDPIRVAEEAAMLDHLSRGRLQLGIGRGGFRQHYDGYGIPLADRQSRFDEALAVLKQAWGPEPMTFQGEHFRYQNANVVPKPLQQPHPPLWMAANSDESVQTAITHDLRMMMAIMTVAPQQMIDRSQRYRAARPTAPDTDIGMLLPIYVAETNDLARADAEHSCISYFREVGRIAQQSLSGSPNDPSNAVKTLPPLAQRFQDMTYDTAAASFAAIGDPDHVAQRLRDIYAQYHCGHIVGWFNFGGRIPHDRVLASMRLFAEQVRPQLP